VVGHQKAEVEVVHAAVVASKTALDAQAGLMTGHKAGHTPHGQTCMRRVTFFWCKRGHMQHGEHHAD
jgi:hypothetical protein